MIRTYVLLYGDFNRTQALEVLPHPTTTNDTAIAFDDDNVVYRGTWSDDSPYKTTEDGRDSLKLLFFGATAASFTLPVQR
jgi:hypothetical protein